LRCKREEGEKRGEKGIISRYLPVKRGREGREFFRTLPLLPPPEDTQGEEKQNQIPAMPK